MAGGVITTGNHPKALKPGVRKWFGMSYDEHEMEYPVLFTVLNSSENYEEDVQATNFGLAPEKLQGDGVSYTSHIQGWSKRYVHIVYGLGFKVTREEFEDNRYKELARGRTTAMAFSMTQTKENVHANIINRMTTAAYTGGDGQVFVVSTHPSPAGSQSNILSPAADMSEQSIEDLQIQVMGATDDQGMQIKLIGESLHIPRQLYYEAERILGSILQNDTALNAKNVLKSTGAFPKGIHMNHYFTDSDAFHIKTNCPNGLLSFQRRAREVTDDNEFDTENAKYKCTERYSCGWTDWRTLYASAGA